LFHCSCCNAFLETEEEIENQYCEECQLTIRCHFDKDDIEGELTHLTYYQANMEVL